MSKRIFDFVSAFILLFLFSPVLIVVFVVLSIKFKNHPFFFQQRTGLDQKIFRIIKFKTMSDAVDSNGLLLPDEQRLSKVGTALRNLSLDELPQLLNVLKGDMSLIGPRPLLPEYLPHYSSVQIRRHEVKPGITGWAQVNGRNSISWEEKFKLDVWYVDNHSWNLDFKIILLTILKILTKDSVSPSSGVTMPRFDKKNTYE